MFDQCQNPTLNSLTIPATQIAGIIEKSDGNIALLSYDSCAYTINISGEILGSQQLFNGAKALSFVEYEDGYWITTSDHRIYVLNPDLSIKKQFTLDMNAVSVAPIEDRGGIIISYFDESLQKSSYEYRSLPDFLVKATGFYGPENPVISSVAFSYNDDLYLACCSKTELSLLKVENGEIINLQHYSERTEGRELNYSQLLAESKRFLIDNMTGRVKPELEPTAYMEKICFFRNDEATHGAIAKRDNWIAFLNPASLKMVNYDTKISYKFETQYKKPSHVKILKYHVICTYTDEVTIYDFRRPSLKFIMDE